MKLLTALKLNFFEWMHPIQIYSNLIPNWTRLPRSRAEGGGERGMKGEKQFHAQNLNLKTSGKKKNQYEVMDSTISTNLSIIFSLFLRKHQFLFIFYGRGNKWITRISINVFNLLNLTKSTSPKLSKGTWPQIAASFWQKKTLLT